MLTKEIILKTLQEQHTYLTTEYGVKRIGLFGSYTRGTTSEASDIDLVVEFQRPIGFKFIELVEYLEKLLGKEVDVLTPAGIQSIRVGNTARTIAESIVYV